VRAGLVIVNKVRIQNAPEVALVEHNDVIQHFAAKGANDSLDERVLPRRAQRNHNFYDAQLVGGRLNFGASDTIPGRESGMAACRREMAGEKPIARLQPMSQGFD
jgi:hypothetical protein